MKEEEKNGRGRARREGEEEKTVGSDQVQSQYEAIQRGELIEVNWTPFWTENLTTLALYTWTSELRLPEMRCALRLRTSSAGS